MLLGVASWSRVWRCIVVGFLRVLHLGDCCRDHINHSFGWWLFTPTLRAYLLPDWPSATVLETLSRINAAPLDDGSWTL